MRVRHGIHRDGGVEWDLDAKIRWYPGEWEIVRTLPRKARWEIAWTKRLRKPVDGRDFHVVKSGKSYVYVREASETESTEVSETRGVRSRGGKF